MIQTKSSPWKIQKVGIAMAVFQPNLSSLKAQLKSIQDQDFTHWICWVVSDSPLNEILESSDIAPFQLDPRFKWIENTVRLGHKENFQKAAQLAVGENVDAIGFSDQDDIWYSNKLSASIRALERAGRLAVVHCDMHLLENFETSPSSSTTAWQIEKRGVHHTQLLHLLVRNVVAGCAMLMDAELVRKYSKIPQEIEFHDHWFALVGAAFGGVFPIATPLYAYRQHSENVLGITRYQGVFNLTTQHRKDIFSYCHNRWQWSHRIAEAVLTAKLPLTKTAKILMISKYDLGLGFIIFGMRNLFSDPSLARACFARGIGKFLSIFLT